VHYANRAYLYLSRGFLVAFVLARLVQPVVCKDQPLGRRDELV
jgi:hypothetical protein